MLTEKELEVLRSNAKVHKKVFDAIKTRVQVGTSAKEINELCLQICTEHNVIPAFHRVYGFPAYICISVNDVVVHGIPRDEIIFQEGDVVTFDFWVKDKEVGVNTDAAFTIIVGDGPHKPEVVEFLEVNQKALYKWIAEARVGNTVGDIGYAIQSYVEKKGFHIVKELTGHGVGKKLHEEPYVYNYGKKWSGKKLKKWMVLAIEPIIGFSSGNIVDKGDWEIYIEGGSLGCQFEHTILITDGDPEIII